MMRMSLILHMSLEESSFHVHGSWGRMTSPENTPRSPRVTRGWTLAVHPRRTMLNESLARIRRYPFASRY